MPSCLPEQWWLAAETEPGMMMMMIQDDGYHQLQQSMMPPQDAQRQHRSDHTDLHSPCTIQHIAVVNMTVTSVYDDTERQSTYSNIHIQIQ